MATTDDIIDAGTKLAVLGVTTKIAMSTLKNVKPIKMKSKKGKSIW